MQPGSAPHFNLPYRRLRTSRLRVPRRSRCGFRAGPLRRSAHLSERARRWPRRPSCGWRTGTRLGLRPGPTRTTMAGREESRPRALVCECSGTAYRRGDKGTGLPPGAFAFSLQLRPCCLLEVQHGYPSVRYRPTCHVADCVQADWQAIAAPEALLVRSDRHRTISRTRMYGCEGPIHRSPGTR